MIFAFFKYSLILLRIWPIGYLRSKWAQRLINFEVSVSTFLGFEHPDEHFTSSFSFHSLSSCILCSTLIYLLLINIYGRWPYLQSLFNSCLRSCFRSNYDSRLQIHTRLEGNGFHRVRLQSWQSSKILRSLPSMSIVSKMYRQGQLQFSVQCPLVQE